MARREDSAVVEATPAAARRPKLIVALGSGRTGKTTLLAWLAPALGGGDMPVRVIDADANNAVLAQRIGAETPPGTDEHDRRMWIEAQIERQIEANLSGKPEHVLLDVGGNDGLVKRLGDELRLADELQAQGIDPVAIYMVGPREADLAYLEDVEARDLFCPPATVVVLNKGLVPEGRTYESAFAPILKHSAVRRVLARGGKVTFMPSLSCMSVVEEEGLTPSQYLERHRDQVRFTKIRVQRWMAEMELMRADFGDWLP